MNFTTSPNFIEVTRKCVRCGEDKTLADYHRSKRDCLGRQRRCKACNHARQTMQIYNQTLVIGRVG
jgi:NADH:ubiquinone oxidoreductase subunit